jgi:hypothetical protein
VQLETTCVYLITAPRKRKEERGGAGAGLIDSGQAGVGLGVVYGAEGQSRTGHVSTTGTTWSKEQDGLVAAAGPRRSPVRKN